MQDGSKPRPHHSAENASSATERNSNTVISSVLDAHRSEYESLMNRATYFILIASSIFPLMAVYLALIAQLCKPTSGSLASAYRGVLDSPLERALLFWGNLFVLELMAVGWTVLQIEQYNIVLYIETELKPKVQALTGDRTVWNYERFLVGYRDARVLRIGELGVLLAFAAAFCIIAILLYPPKPFDYIGLSLTGGLLAMQVKLNHLVYRTRRRWQSELSDSQTV